MSLRHGRFWAEKLLWSGPAEAISPKIQLSPNDAHANRVERYGHTLRPSVQLRWIMPRASIACSNQPMKPINDAPGIEAMQPCPLSGIANIDGQGDVTTPRSLDSPVANVAARASA